MNISEIARLAGVSNAAVSRFFNNGYVSEEKREAIRRVVEETGYRPLPEAQTLRTKRSMTIGVVVPKMASSAMGQVVDGILSVLDLSGYQMLLGVTGNERRKDLDYLRSFSGRSVDGVLYIASGFDREHMAVLKRMRTPVVIIGQRLDGYTCIFHDDYHAIYDMTTLVCESGRLNIAYLGVSLTDPAAGTGREQGFRDALLRSGHSVREEAFCRGEFSVSSGYRCAEEIFTRCPRTDAIVCATDEIAAGAMLFLQRQGKKIPEDVMLTGLGDSDLIRVAGNEIRTIHYAYRESGEKAAQILLGCLSGEETLRQHLQLPYQLV